MAAKKGEMVPLCHPIALTAVEVGAELVAPATAGSEVEEGGLAGGEGDGVCFGGWRSRRKSSVRARRGVEMEALTAVMGSALTVFDM
jgi:cyclic pyranopterin phosphate synthase